MCEPSIRLCVLDLVLVLEAREEDELPERVLGGVRLHHLDMSQPAVMQGQQAYYLLRKRVDGADSEGGEGRQKTILRPLAVGRRLGKVRVGCVKRAFRFRPIAGRERQWRPQSLIRGTT